LTTVLREQPNLLVEHTKKFQAIRMKQFSPPNNPNLPISSNPHSARRGSSIKGAASRRLNETAYSQKFNWPIINSKTDYVDYARTSCSFDKSQAGGAVQHQLKNRKRESQNSSALAHHSLVSSKVIEEESRAETPAANL